MTDKKPVPISEKSSKTLAAQVVAYRVLGINKDDSILAMEELQKRKIAGDDFDFNKYIQEHVNSAPKIENNNNSDLLKQIINYAKQ